MDLLIYAIFGINFFAQKSVYGFVAKDDFDKNLTTSFLMGLPPNAVFGIKFQILTNFKKCNKLNCRFKEKKEFLKKNKSQKIF